MKPRQYCHATLVFLALSIAVFRVQASTAVYQNGQYFSGEEFHFNDAFETAAGLYKAELYDYHYPAAFTSLSLLVTQDDPADPESPVDLILGAGYGTDWFTFNVVDTDSDPLTPVLLSVHVSGKGPLLDEEKGIYGTGLYSMRIVPIPIPPASWLFISALTGIVAVARRGRGAAWSDR